MAFDWRLRQLRIWLRCPICRCWFGTHDHAVLHGDGRTDDTDALQLRIYRGGIPKGEFRVKGPLQVKGPIHVTDYGAVRDIDEETGE